MKKLIFIILLIPAMVFGSDIGTGSNSIGAGSASIGTVDNNGDITFWLNGEANDNTGDYNMSGSECSDGDTSGAYNSSINNVDSLKIGSYGFDHPTSWDRIEFTISSYDVVPQNSARIGFWVRIVTWADGSSLIDIQKDADEYILLEMAGTGDGDIEFRLKIYDDVETDISIGTSAGTQVDGSLNTWYFVEIYWNNVGGTDAYGIVVDGTSRITGTDNLPDNDSVYVRWGNSLGTSADFHQDNMMVSDDYTYDLYGSGTGRADDTTKPSGACDG
jgi:hypothetical protein